MKELYKGSKESLEKAKSGKMREKTQKLIASLLMAGNLVLSGGEVLASQQYTPEQLEQHNQYAEEYMKQDNLIQKNSRVVLEQEYKEGRISKEQYSKALESLTKIHQIAEETVSSLRKETRRITDKNIVYLKILPSKSGDTKPRIELNLNDISSLDKEKLEYLEKKYEIENIVLSRYYRLDKGDKLDKQFVYSKDDYKKMLEVMEEKFGDLKGNDKLSDLEKTIIVLKRFENIKYDYDALNTTDLSSDIASTSRSLKDPLLKETGICAGFTDLFKNAMSYIGIESKEIGGYVKGVNNPNTIPGQANHAWNQVKIDDKWYNLDITEMVTRSNFLEKGEVHGYVLTSDKEFNNIRSKYLQSAYTPIFGLAEKCDESIPNEDIDKAIIHAIEYEKSIKNNSKKKGMFAKLKEKFTKNKNENVEEISEKKGENKRDKFLADLKYTNNEKEQVTNVEQNININEKDNDLER